MGKKLFPQKKEINIYIYWKYRQTLKTSNLVTSLERVSYFQLSCVRSLQSSALAEAEPMTATYVMLTEVWCPRIFELSLFNFFSVY